MSVIVAIRKGNTAVIVADTQVAQGNTIVDGATRNYPPKIHQVGAAFVGIVGSMAHHSVLRSLSASRAELFNFESGDAIFETLRKIHPLLREEYFLMPKENDDDQEYESMQMHGLAISPSGVFSFSSTRDVSEYKTFWAAGSGMDFALGAMEATYTTNQTARAIAELAVQTACKFDSASGLPVVSFELTLSNESY